MNRQEGPGHLEPVRKEGLGHLEPTRKGLDIWNPSGKRAWGIWNLAMSSRDRAGFRGVHYARGGS
jgi:hypothetical protein